MKQAWFTILLISAASLWYNAQAQCSVTTTPTNNCSYGDAINSFTLNSISTTGNSGCASNGYVFYTSPVRTLTQGMTYNFSVTVGSSVYTEGFALWIDLNNNNTYETSELLYASSSAGSGFTGTITIPNTATVANNVHMRTMCAWATTISANQACTSGLGSGYGETEDYYVNITSGCPITVSTQPHDTAACTGNNAGFSVAGSNINSYQWQESTNSGTSWSNLSNGGWYSGVTTSSLLISNVTIGMNSNQYRCVLTNSANSCSVNSTAKTLTVNQTPQIATTTPGFACMNGSGQVGATGTTGVTVRWWNQATGGTMLGTGNTYTISSATGTANYYAEPYVSTVQQSGSISTSTANNGQAVATFDCKPLTNMTVTGFDFTPRTSTTYTASIYYRTGTMVGNTGSSSGWTLLGTSSSFSATANTVTAIPLTVSLSLTANQTYAFYVYVTGGTLGYTNGSGTPGATLFASNSDMQIFEGYGSNGLFSSSLYTTRTFAGTIHYTKSVTPPCTNTNRTAVLLTVDAPAQISAHPSSATLCSGLNASFGVTATNVGSYQWQESTNGGTSWSDITNGGVYGSATTATLNLTSITSGLNNNQYRCKLTSPCSIVNYSNAATLGVNAEPSVTSHPADAAACIGSSASFSCAATGYGTLSYQWEMSFNSGTNWSTVFNGGFYSGATTSTLTVSNITSVLANYQFRCIVTGTCAPPATSNPGTLTVNTAPTITTQPVNTDGCPASTVTFTCAATGGGINYQWQEYGTSWSNITNGGVYSGATTATLTLNGITPAMDGQQYRCLVTGACTPPDTTDEPTLTVNPVPTVSGSSNSPVCEGKDLMLSSLSSTSGVTYGWTGPGAYNSTLQNPTLSGPTTANSGNYIVTATITATGCTATATVPVVIKTTPVISSISSNAPVCTGYDINLTSSSDAGATYSWTGPLGFSSTAQNPVRNKVSLQMGGYYKLESTLNGCVSIPDSVNVTIVPSPSIGAYPTPGVKICDGDTIWFYAFASNTGTGPTYQWMKNGQDIPGATSLQYTGTGLMNGDIIKLRMSPGTGLSCTADIFTQEMHIVANPMLAPGVNIVMDPATPVWDGLLVTFTATPKDAGKNPQYQWKRNGKDINGATGSVWSTTSLDDKDVIECVIFSDYECAQPTSSTSNQVTVPVLTSVSNTAGHTDLSLFPNPNNGSFTLKGRVNKGKVQVEVLNALGQVIYKNEFNSADGNLQQNISPGNMADGIYMLRITSGTEQDNIRFRVAN